MIPAGLYAFSLLLFGGQGTQAPPESAADPVVEAGAEAATEPAGEAAGEPAAAAVAEPAAAAVAEPAAEPAKGTPGDASLEDKAGAVRTLLDTNCTFCHSAESDLDLTGPVDGLVAIAASTGAPLVAPGDPGGSYLLAKMMGEDIKGSAMPMGGSALPPDQLAVVSDWIASLEPLPEGAEAPQAAPPKPRANFFGTHQINQQTTTSLGKKTFEFRVHHRFGKLIAPRSYLGLANGATMSLGVGYGIVDGLDALARWSNAGLDWELGLKYAPLRQVDGKPLSLAAFASFEALADDPAKAENRFTGNFQVMLSRLWFERWSTQLMVNWSMFTNHAVGPRVDFGDGAQIAEDRRGTLDLGLASTVWLGKKKKHGIDLEYTLPVPAGGNPDLFFFQGGDAALGGANYGNVAVGWSARAGLHLFQIFVTNQNAIHTNQVAPGPGGRIEDGDIYLGFNISRRWKL